jgi:uncharacterized protein YkwD
MSRICVGLCTLALLAIGTLNPAAGDDPKPKDEPKLELSKLEKDILELTNKERDKEKLPPLVTNALLFKAARGHSANMAKKGELNHVLDDKNPGKRLDDVGYSWLEVGENIALGTDETAADILKLWMGSELHKANILNKDFKQIGIGVAKNDKGELYYTQVFGTPQKK